MSGMTERGGWEPKILKRRFTWGETSPEQFEAMKRQLSAS